MPTLSSVPVSAARPPRRSRGLVRPHARRLHPPDGGRGVTLRHGFPLADLDSLKPDLVVFSPGPGTPKDFDVSGTVAARVERGLPVFGVCLGLQGIVEHFGGELEVLSYPMHGKPSRMSAKGGVLFDNFPAEFVAGRYHSLYAATSPDELL